MNIISFIEAMNDLPDPRDNRGKSLDFPFIVTAVILAIMTGRSQMSSIHRYIRNRIDWLREISQMPQATIISRAHLPRLLNRVDWDNLNQLIRKHFGFQVSFNSQGEWVAIDGKTLRGTTNAGDKQGEKVVLAVTHKTRTNLAQFPMSGPKAGEVSVVRDLLKQTGLKKAKVTLDALHCTPKTTTQINQAGGAYIIQVKENQEILRKQLQKRPDEVSSMGTQSTTDKGHGRLEKRCATFFPLSDLRFHKRWNKSNFQTLIVMNRQTFEKAKQKATQETSYYITNQVIKKSHSDAQKELFDAVREHWGVESDNWIRDVTFNEDHVKTKSRNLARVLATLRTLTIGLFRKAEIKNFKECCEDFTDNQSLFEAFLKKVGFV